MLAIEVRPGVKLTNGHQPNIVVEVWHHNVAPGMSTYGRASMGQVWLVMSSGATWVYDTNDVVNLW